MVGEGIMQDTLIVVTMVSHGVVRLLCQAPRICAACSSNLTH